MAFGNYEKGKLIDRFVEMVAYFVVQKLTGAFHHVLSSMSCIFLVFLAFSSHDSMNNTKHSRQYKTLKIVLNGSPNLLQIHRYAAGIVQWFSRFPWYVPALVLVSIAYSKEVTKF